MKKRKRSESDRPVGKLSVVDDFLPSPEELAKTLKTRKVTMDLETAVIEFFKKQAELSDSKYQRLMREVLRQYVRRYSQAS